jgi:alkanesulfonate monooxygenase SsuD/methylene tetrahydromethanopterin reductase-like flavin-dependent oxidoreductase (luciferase family)
MKIGLLEFGSGPPDVSWMMENVIDYAVSADKLGFSRIWLGEHYFFNHFWYNPEVLLPIIAGMTDNIRVGVAGILLAIHSPYRIALNFKMLSTLFPDRIDLGVANGSPSMQVVKLMLQKTDEECLKYRESFYPKFLDLLKYTRAEGDLWKEKIYLPPHGGGIPEIWSLGTSYKNLEKILNHDVNFCRSIFHIAADREHNKELLLEYKEKYFNTYGKAPKINVSFSGICQKTSQAAKRLLIKMGKEEEENLQSIVIGCPNKFHDTLKQMEEDYGVDEFIMLNLIYTKKQKLNSLELISDKCLNK